MEAKILVIDDEPEDIIRFARTFRDHGCSVLSLSSPTLDEEQERIRAFGPQLAIIDSRFGNSELEGLAVITKLFRIVSLIPVVVCSELVDDRASRRWLESRYVDAPGVRGILGKKPFPTASQMLSYLESIP